MLETLLRMRIKETPRGAVPVLTPDERKLLDKTVKLMERVSEKLDATTPANDDMGARASMVANDIWEFWTAVEEA